MNKPVYDPSAKVRVVSDSPIGRRAILSIGNVAVPFYQADIHIAPDEIITVTVKAKLDDLEIETLQEHTRIEVERSTTHTPQLKVDGAADSANPNVHAAGFRDVSAS